MRPSSMFLHGPYRSSAAVVHPLVMLLLCACYACAPVHSSAGEDDSGTDDPFQGGRSLAAGPLRPAIVTERVQEDSDDPAIWIDPLDPTASLILGTDKSETDGGVYAFDLNGRIVADRTVRGLRRPNNVDVQDGFVYGGDTISIAVATERLRMAIRVFRLPSMEPIDAGGIEVFGGPNGDTLRAPMGVSVYRRPSDGAVFAIVGGKSGPTDGYLHQIRLVEGRSGSVEGRLVRAFGRYSGLNEIEALEVDDSPGFVYYSDEGTGIRKYHADPDHAAAEHELALFGRSDFVEDHEGIGIYATGPTSGYLLISDQQGGSLNVYRREGAPDDPHRHELIAAIPVSSLETDGVAATSTPLGPAFPEGLVVMMSTDGTFHYYRWEDVLARIEAAQTGGAAPEQPE